ncbi:alpha-L-fucosidase [Kutzneria buriramensis]|uniref:alpha-L-fucosidase n=1 Tax=Kutzneria buriramensis TaxID=1045776 RepID=A0A3E0IAZ0_9PSEU|nr:alpha-L-fucosidase [Kutzneria buriramensis]REH55898.1 alpha-L-fucosidase [Kutzneria buriramensis]
MTTFPRRTALGLALGATALATISTGTGAAFAASDAPNPVPVPLDGLFDNDGIDTATTHDGNFDGSGYTFPAEGLPSGPITVDGVPFTFPAATGKNNIVAMGQQIPLPKGRYVTALFLTACSYGATGGTATVHYADGTTSQAQLGGADWYSGSGQLVAPFRYTPGGGTDQSPVSISTSQVWLDPARDAVAITLPTTNPAVEGKSSLHVFALSLQPVVVGKAVTLRGTKSTTSLLTDAGPQVVEATVVNLGTEWITPQDQLTISVTVPGGRTVTPATVAWLAPGDEAKVRIGIRKNQTVDDGTTVNGTLTAKSKKDTLASAQAPILLGVPDYQPADTSLNTHQAPYWFQDAKFGIFIHWGVYSVPAWSPPGKQYAEWYWNWMQDPSNAVYDYHRQTFGANFNYDDFIPQFKAEKWNPLDWLNLFVDAGARYYVLTSKHHEGFALWDSKVSGRTAAKLGPKRDLVKDLFAASRQHTPQLRNGLYFSMPEWFNPDNPWMGHAPRNPYTGAAVPYTGYASGRDFVLDYQLPQMLELVHGYDPDVIWCDIGGVNDSRRLMAEYFNHAKDRPRPKDVTINDRSGISVHDFTTPEYATYPNTVVAKWEASRGLDPRSYGYNRATPDDMYMTAEEVVHTLVDIVSKNGNFLLDIGPRADGTIPEIMQTRLRQTGAWLKVNGESIYDTSYWSRQAQLGDLRFTVKSDAFYITSLTAPGSQLTVAAPVPIRPGDTVTMLGYRTPLTWAVTGGSLVVDVPAAAVAAGQYAWVFKISRR